MVPDTAGSQDSCKVTSDVTTYLQVCTVIRMHLFSIAAVRNYHKLSGLKEHKFIILPSCRPEVQPKCHGAIIKVLAKFLLFFWRPVFRRICFLVLSSFQRVLVFLDCWSPSIICTALQGYTVSPVLIFPLDLISSTFKDPCNCTQHSQTIQDTPYFHIS